MKITRKEKILMDKFLTEEGFTKTGALRLDKIQFLTRFLRFMKRKGGLSMEITEIWPPMTKQPEWTVEAIEKGQLFCEAFRRIDHFQAALEDIRDLAVNYDGFLEAKDLKTLIDDMSNVAEKAINLEEWTENVK